jgi:deoxycytidine triphosphate deaminase
MQTLARKLPHVLEQMDRMIEENFRSEFFVSAETVDREIEARVQRLLNGPPVVVNGNSKAEKQSEKNSEFVA